MAQLILINKITYKEGLNEIGDIVEIVEDNHIFSQIEKIQFDIKQITGNKLKAKLDYQAILPEIKSATKSETTKWTFDTPKQINMFKRGKDWIKIDKMPKYKVKFIDGKFVEKVTSSGSEIIEVE